LPAKVINEHDHFMMCNPAVLLVDFLLRTGELDQAVKLGPRLLDLDAREYRDLALSKLLSALVAADRYNDANKLLRGILMASERPYSTVHLPSVVIVGMLNHLPSDMVPLITDYLKYCSWDNRDFDILRCFEDHGWITQAQEVYEARAQQVQSAHHLIR